MLDEPYGSSSDGQSGDGLAFISKTSCGPFELGAVVGVGKGCFEAVELVLFRPRAGEAGSLGVVPPGSCSARRMGLRVVGSAATSSRVSRTGAGG